MKKLYMHVGQDKTGSSFLQSCLAASKSKLQECGIYYPVNNQVLLAKEGKISSGNGALLSNIEHLDKRSLKSNSVLFSSEMLYRHLPDDEFTANIKNNLLKPYGFKHIEALLYIRNPIDHFTSSYQQAVKRGGYTETLSEFSKTYKRHINAVRRFVRYCNDNQNIIKLTSINYSHNRDSIVQHLENWLGLHSKTLTLPPVAVTNRSMTLAELEFQRLANEFYGKDAKIISDSLCEKLPAIPSDQLDVAIEIHEKVTESTNDACVEIDKILYSLSDSNEGYSYDTAHELRKNDKLELTKEQIKVIFNCIKELGSK